MDNNPLKWTLWSTPLLRVLDFMLDHPEEELIDAEIAARVKSVKKSAVNIALRKLSDLGVVERRRRGRMVFNRLIESPLVLQFKVLNNLMCLKPLVDALSPLCSSIALFGSRADGTHISGSDYDVLVVTSDEGGVLKVVRRSALAEHLQVIIKSSEQMLTFDKDEPVLAKEVKKGITLWQRK